MEFYYPTSGKMTYFIKFDWGEYIITTEDKKGTEVHEDSKSYLGYITFRPEITRQPSEGAPGYYVITPEGIVWENITGQGIPKTSERQEISTKKTEHGTSTQTNTIQSVSEPLIDHFKEYPEQWRRYGKLDIQGKKTHLIIEDRSK
jgi:hypothetical protein